jgi:hypothetical protein
MVLFYSENAETGTVCSDMYDVILWVQLDSNFDFSRFTQVMPQGILSFDKVVNRKVSRGEIRFKQL